MCIYRLIAVVSRPSVYTHRILRLAEALCGCHHVRLSTGFFKSLEQPCWTGFCGSLSSRVWTAIHKNMYQDAGCMHVYSALKPSSLNSVLRIHRWTS